MAKAKEKTEQTPEQIRQRGKQLLQLAKQKETEIKNKQVLTLGQILQREINSNWQTSWQQFAEELEQIVGKKITYPTWGRQQNQQQNLQA